MWFGRKQQDGTATPAQTGTPLELVRHNPTTGKFEVAPEALQALRKVKTPVGVVAVSGRARQGKSFILNQLLGQSAGFKVAPTVRPCTKGLWMWSAPIRKSLPDGRTYHLVLLDTEGIDAYDQTGQYSTQIFSLAVLLSSLFVYNQMGGIDEAALDRLSLVTEMTKHIRVRANEGSSTETELSSFTPSFLWLLRDFYLTLEDNGRHVTAREYLETALAPVGGRGPSVEAKNQIRESIKALFPDRDCFTLVRPVNDEKQLQQLESVPPSQLRPEFKEGLARLTDTIFRRALPKKLGSLEVNGAMLAGLAEAYVQALNEGAVPTIATAWQGVAEAECRRAADTAEAAYVQSFNQGIEAEEGSLDAEHQRCLDVALEVYQEAAVGHEEPRKANEKRLRDVIDKWYSNFKQTKLANAALGCEKLVREAAAKMAEFARSPGATPSALKQHLKEFEATYGQQASGPTKWQVFTEFLQGTFVGLLSDVAERERTAAQRSAMEAAQRAQQAELAAKEAELQRHQLASRMADVDSQAAEATRRAAMQQASMADKDAKIAALERELQNTRTAKETDIARSQQTVRDQMDLMLTERNAQISQLKSEVASLQTEMATLSAERDTLKRQLQTTLDAQRLLEGKVASLEYAQNALISERDKAIAAQSNLQQAAAQHQAEFERWKAEQQQDMDTFVDAAPNMPGMAADGDAACSPINGRELNPADMTVKEIKEWLMQNGASQKVWELSQKRTTKKQDWVALMQQKLGA